MYLDTYIYIYFTYICIYIDKIWQVYICISIYMFMNIYIYIYLHL